MFNTNRFHRFLTVPALVVALAALLLTKYVALIALAFPPVIALPYFLRAANDPSPKRVADALFIVRASGLVMVVWGAFLVVWSGTAALIMCGAGALLLGAAAKATSEMRLALLGVLVGLMQTFVSLPLLWLGEQFFGSLLAGIVLVIGSLVWAVEAELHPHVETDFPTAIAA